MHDVAVVGAGPAGLRAAALLRARGLDVAVLEEHGSIGEPVQCSGLVSANIRRLVRLPRECVLHSVRGAVIHSGGTRLTLSKKGTAAYVVDRALFDRHLAGEAGSVLRGCGVRGMRVTGSGIRLSTSRGAFGSEVVVGADGPNSLVARHFGSRPRELLQGIIAIARERDHSDMVELFVDKALAPEGFLWRIPRGDSVEYGMWSRSVSFGRLEGFFGLGPGYERRGGLIPLGPGRTCFERALLVGDAAGQVKPWSGGGVVYGLVAAGMAAQTIWEAFEHHDFSERSLSAYEARWKDGLGTGIGIGMLGRRVFERVGGREAGAALRLLGLFGPLLNRMDMDLLGP
jgi:digeranylgeranylglycerophospholipid reductase